MKKSKQILFFFLSMGVLLLCSSGCSSLGVYNAATGRSEFIFVPTAKEVSMGQDVHHSLAQKYTFSQNPRYVNRVQRLGQKLALVSDRQDYEYHFYVVEGKDLNAFTTPGGNIYVYTGLLEKMDKDEEVAFVLAHEIGHCAARHTIKKFQAGIGYQMIGGLLLDQLKMGAASRRIAVLSSNIVTNLIFSAYSRQDEYEADRLGVKYMYLAGFDPKAAPESLELLKEESKDSKGILWLRSHPYLDDRILKVKEETEKVQQQFQG